MRVRDPPELHSRSQTRVRRARHRHPLPYFLFPLKNTAEPSPQPTGCMSATNPARCREPWDERTAAPRHTRDHQTWLRGNAGARGTFPLSTGCYLHSKSRQSHLCDQRAACPPHTLTARCRGPLDERTAMLLHTRQRPPELAQGQCRGAGHVSAFHCLHSKTWQSRHRDPQAEYLPGRAPRSPHVDLHNLHPLPPEPHRPTKQPALRSWSLWWICLVHPHKTRPPKQSHVSWGWRGTSYVGADEGVEVTRTPAT